jgi:hypothetical protein
MVSRRQSQFLAATFVASAALVGSIGVAAALTAGATGFYTVNGIGYKNVSYVGDTSSYPFGGANVATQSGSNVGAGWMGTLPRLYLSDGALCQQDSSYYYNTGPAYAVYAATEGPGCGRGSYYGYGVTESWNSSTSSYHAYYTFRSPNLTY